MRVFLRINFYNAIVLLMAIDCIFTSCSSIYPGRYLPLGASTAAGFFGHWVYLLSDYFFWIYAVLFGLLAYGRKKEALKRHVVITLAIYASFQWTSCPACACIIPYYVGMPLMYIPNFKSKFLDSFFGGGTVLAWIYLCFMDWQQENFSSWIMQIGVWGVVGFIFAFFLSIDLNERCPHCGHFSLSDIGETDRYQNAAKHFNVLDENGADQFNVIDGGLKRKSAFRRCGYCFNKIGNGL